MSLFSRLAEPWAKARRSGALDVVLWGLILLAGELLIPGFNLPWRHGLVLVLGAVILPVPGTDASVSRLLAWQSAILLSASAYLHWVVGIAWPVLAWILFWLPAGLVLRATWSRPGAFVLQTAWTAGRGVWTFAREFFRQYAARRGDILVAELGILGSVLYLGGTFFPAARSFPSWSLVALALWPLLRGWRNGHRPTGSAATDFGRQGLALLGTAGLMVVLSFGQVPLGRLQLVLLAAGGGGLWLHRLALRSAEKARGIDGGESHRWVLLIVSGLWLLRSFAQVGRHGTDDAYWYGTVLVDAVTQARAGIFPLFIGQSEYQFNGSFYPLRAAPVFPYLGILLDAATLHALGTFALQNLLITLLGLATAFSSYLCLARLGAPCRWLAALLALLFLSCPGVLGLAHNKDHYMLWSGLPLVPVILFAAARCLMAPDRNTFLLLGLTTGLLWWAHSPVAIWSMVFLPPALLLGGFRQYLRPGPWLAGAAAFALVAAYPIGSVLFYPPTGSGGALSLPAPDPAVISHFISESSPAVLLPLSANGRAEADYQLGYALWAVGLAGGWLAWRQRSKPVAALFVSPLLIVMLLAPVPGLNPALWTLVPRFIRNANGNWAMDRFYVLLAGLTVTIFCVLFTGTAPQTRRSRAVWLALLLAACGWSFHEAAKFARGSGDEPETAAHADDRLRPENQMLTRYAYKFFPSRPPYYSHGVMDPVMEHRLLERESLQLVRANPDDARRQGAVVATADFVRQAGQPTLVYQAAPAFVLQPGKSYLFLFDFQAPTGFIGVLQMAGPRFLRQYELSDYGEARAFGLQPGRARWLSVTLTTPDAQTIESRIFSDNDPQAPWPEVAVRLQLLEYDARQLPVRVESWLPYRLRVNSQVAATVETPRMFQEGYRATVNGASQPVRRSPDNLVAVDVPAGDSVVELRWQAPIGLLALFWLSLGGLVVCGKLLLTARQETTTADQPLAGPGFPTRRK